MYIGGRKKSTRLDGLKIYSEISIYYSISNLFII